MPAKAPLDENVKFLFSCLLRSDYKTIDFARVAADFSINPAAARMRWSRLKKTINPGEEPPFANKSLFTSESPKKTKWPPKRPRGSKEPKEEKEISREIHKEKRAERKAKIRAGQKIGVVVKDEAMTEEYYEAGNKVDASGPENTGLAVAENQNGGEQTPRQDAVKTEDNDILESPRTPEHAQQDDDLRTPQTSETPFGLFKLPPTTPQIRDLFPITPSSSQTTAPGIGGELRGGSSWGSTITVKHDADPMAGLTNISAFFGSPVSSASSFSPVSSARTSPLPPAHAVNKSEQKWRAVNTGGRQAPGRSLENISGVENDTEA